MKLVTVFLLVALPALCYAGSGCALLETVVKNTMDPTMSPADYRVSLGPLVQTSLQGTAVEHMKACFNSNAAVLPAFQDFMNTVYGSSQCMLN